MIRVVKHRYDHIKNFFEFVECDYYDDFELIRDVLLDDFHAKLLEEEDAIWAKGAVFDLNNMEVNLMYHADMGNGIYSYKNDPEITAFIEKLANDMIPYIVDRLNNPPRRFFKKKEK